MSWEGEVDENTMIPCHFLFLLIWSLEKDNYYITHYIVHFCGGLPYAIIAGGRGWKILKNVLHNMWEIPKFKTIAWIKKFCKCDHQKLGFLRQMKVWGAKKVFWGPPKHKKLIFSKNWNYMIWQSIVWDSHSAKYQGPIGR